MKRISWEKYALELAKTAAIRSQDPYRKVGACALDWNNRVLGVAYNGLAPGKNVSSKFWQNRDGRLPYMLHAEQNLLSLFNRGQCKLIAVTLLPCVDCARLICCWNIPVVIYHEPYQRDTTALDVFKFYKVQVKKI